jgi:hypothetical protein
MSQRERKNMMDKPARNIVMAALGFGVMLGALFLLLFFLSGAWIFSLVMSSCVTGVLAAGAWLTSRRIKL